MGMFRVATADEPRFGELLSVDDRIHGEVCRIDAVEIVQDSEKADIQRVLRDVVAGFLNAGQRRSKIRIVAGRSLLDFGQRRQRNGRVQIVRYLEVVVEVRENQDGQIETGIQQRSCASCSWR